MKKKNNPILLELTAAVMLILVLVSNGCSANGPDVVEIDENADGSTVQIGVGDELVLSLESNPSTGYSWQLSSPIGPFLNSVGEVEFIDEGEEDLVGAAGVEVFRFQAEQPGTVALSLVYLRTWEEGVSPIGEFNVTVEISE